MYRRFMTDSQDIDLEYQNSVTWMDRDSKI